MDTIHNSLMLSKICEHCGRQCQASWLVARSSRLAQPESTVENCVFLEYRECGDINSSLNESLSNLKVLRLYEILIAFGIIPNGMNLLPSHGWFNILASDRKVFVCGT